MNEIRLILPGSVVSKKNSKRPAYIGGKNVPRRMVLLPSKAYTAWERGARSSLWGQAIIPPLTCPVHVEAHFYYKGPRPDLSGCCESVGDCLQGIIWADDGEIESWDGSRRHHDPKNPRTEITVRW